ncbi:LysM peptidoglycan-binding domain-containing protein [Roseivirga sp. BDSF3-8]|uniref:CIS tube protein n=1 Tax=Roseivirga sp. BDSF3-8 TaxID=3241598 RepID=UPI0035319CFF
MASFGKLAGMATGATGEDKFIKLKIVGYQDPTRQKKHKEYEVFLNPNQITQNHTVVFAQEEALGSTAPENKFNKTGPQTLGFTLLLDGTGATGEIIEVGEHIAKFKDAAYNYIGETHETPYLKVTYGSHIEFNGRLQTLNITYEMFKPNGDPLRAKLLCNFTTAEDRKTNVKKNSANSPDLSHLVTVKEGDNLPMMCERVYGDSTKYLDVARINNLVNFRNLKPGTELLFPPIR